MDYCFFHLTLAMFHKHTPWVLLVAVVGLAGPSPARAQAREQARLYQASLRPPASRVMVVPQGEEGGKLSEAAIEAEVRGLLHGLVLFAVGAGACPPGQSTTARQRSPYSSNRALRVATVARPDPSRSCAHRPARGWLG